MPSPWKRASPGPRAKPPGAPAPSEPPGAEAAGLHPAEATTTERLPAPVNGAAPRRPPAGAPRALPPGSPGTAEHRPSPARRLSSSGRRAAGERCWSWLGHGLTQKGSKAWLGRKPLISLDLGSFQSASLAAGRLASPRAQPGRREKLMGLARFQTQRCWPREAGLLSRAVSNRPQRRTGLFP